MNTKKGMIRSGDIHVFPVGYTILLYNRRLHQFLHGLVKNSAIKKSYCRDSRTRVSAVFSYKEKCNNDAKLRKFLYFQVFFNRNISRIHLFVTRCHIHLPLFCLCYSLIIRGFLMNVFLFIRETQPWNTPILRVPWRCLFIPDPKWSLRKACACWKDCACRKDIAAEKDIAAGKDKNIKNPLKRRMEILSE